MVPKAADLPWSAILPVLLAVVFLAGSFNSVRGARDPRKDPESGKVRVLYVGDCLGLHTPARNLEMDPLVVTTGIPATAAWYSTKDIKKFIRIYMPRTHAALVDHQDLIILSDAGPQFFSPIHHAYFRESVVEDALGLIMIGGVETFGAESGRMPWIGYPVAEILPVGLITGSFNPNTGVAHPVKLDNPFMESLPWDTMVSPHCNFYRFNNVELKQGANLLGILEARDGQHPWLVDWEAGEGWTFAMCADWTPLGGSDFMRWEYYGDYVSNLCLYVAGLPVPGDLELKHLFIVALKDYWLESSILMGTVDFVELFGANTGPLLAKLGEVNARKGLSESLYIEQNFQEAVPTIESTVEDIRQLNRDAMDLKDRTLFWMYVIEYFSVTGVSLLAGLSLYWLMIRRKMYREMGVTRGRATRL